MECWEPLMFSSKMSLIIINVLGCLLLYYTAAVGLFQTLRGKLFVGMIAVSGSEPKVGGPKEKVKFSPYILWRTGISLRLYL